MSQDKKYEEKKTSLTAAAAELVQDMDFSIHGHDGSDHNEFGKHRCIPSFSAKEFELGRVLGRGSFSIVYEVTSIDLIESLTYFSDRENLVRTSMKEKCQRRNGDVDNSRYAVKVLNPDLPEEQRNLGREDLANEAFFLRDISHSNIIKMRAISTSSSKSLKFFIVLDRLYGTLEQKIYKWKSKSVGIKSIFTSKKGKNKHLAERLTVAFDIVCALQYLHENNIVYRDLKPDNIGFDVRGDIKLFDFGLAKTLEAKDLVDDTTYKLTGNTGSLLYMAPEVFHNKPYNTKVDIYSFGILYWQICAMESPFPNFTCKMIEDLVLKEGYRPSVMDGWSWGDVMKSCWANDISVRPSAEDLLKSIGELLVEVSGASNFKDRTRSSLGS